MKTENVHFKIRLCGCLEVVNTIQNIIMQESR